VRVLLLGTGRGRESTDDLVSPDAVAKPQLDDPKDLKQRLDRLL
jgi:hypothetical protein